MISRSRFSFLCFLFALVLCWTTRLVGQSVGQAIFSEVDQRVSTLFCDAKFHGIDWSEVSRQTADRLANVEDVGAAARVINEALAQLKTSHTFLFTLDDPELYELLGVFASSEINRGPIMDWLKLYDRADLRYEGIGIRAQHVNNRWFVRALLPDSPASQAGVRLGDELIRVEGKPFHPLLNFRNRAGETVTLQVSSTAQSEPRDLRVSVQWYDPVTMFHDAIQASARVVHTPTEKIAYVRMWSYAGQAYQDRLIDLLSTQLLSDCDRLVLDLRGGWGGASMEFVQHFLPEIASIEYIKRDGQMAKSDNRWLKPTTLLIDDTVRSGKELFAYGFKKLKRGELIGGTTAGAVTAGMPITLSHGCVLYLAVSRLSVDGQMLEGVGVSPTIEVKNDWVYAEGRDAIFDAAIPDLGATTKFETK